VSEPGSAARPIGRLLRAGQTTSPDAIVETIATAVAGIGGTDVVLYLIDYEQLVLIPFLDLLTHGELPQPASVDGTMAGRAFSSNSPVASERDDGWHVWIPVMERVNRLGVLSITLPHWDDAIEDQCQELGYATAHLVIASAQYTDLPHVLRRRKNMDLAAEMQWSLLPPLSFATADVAVAGLLEPAYEVGGDSFDYALNARMLDLAVFDAMGHGLTSAVLASLLMGAYRHARREYRPLNEIADAIDLIVREIPGGAPFATALIGRLDVLTGQLSWVSCGHPQPIVVRNGSRLPDANLVPWLPLGLGALRPAAMAPGTVVHTQLEPGDGVLLYTDGVVESQREDGDEFGQARLADLLIREHQAGGPPQEVVRRLVRSALQHSGALRDDASLLYLRWHRGA
jgi:serine phosphatase RsbU (regulator of sigma subunit)